MARKQRILYIAHARFPTERGHGQQIAKLCEALGRKAEVTLIAPALSRADPFNFYGIQDTFRVKLLKVPRLPRSTRVGFLLEKILFLLRAAKEARRQKPDIVITREPLLCLFWRGLMVLELHDLPRALGVYSFFLKRCTWLIAKTTYVKEQVARAGVDPARIIVLANAVDLEKVQYAGSREDACARFALSAKGVIIGYWGSLLGWKGVDVLLRAAAHLPDKVVAIAGGRPEEVAAKRKEYPGDNIIFLGHRPYTELGAFLAAADILVLPNVPGTALSERYTSPLKLFEYMGAAKPIVASRLPAIEEAVSEREVFFFEAGSPEDLSRVIDEVVKDPRDAQARAEHARLSVQANTWDAYAERLLELSQKPPQTP